MDNTMEGRPTKVKRGNVKKKRRKKVEPKKSEGKKASKKRTDERRQAQEKTPYNEVKRPSKKELESRRKKRNAVRIKKKKKKSKFKRFLRKIIMIAVLIGLLGAGGYYGYKYLIPEKTVIVVDAGHGGIDPGNTSYSGRYFEKDINLRVSNMLARELRKRGFKVLMTRTDDTKIPLYDRAKFANENDADFFISIHQNASENSRHAGYETLYANKYDDPQKQERQGELLNSVHQSIVENIDLRDRGIKEDYDVVVLRETNCPAVLLEMGFLTNSAEEKKVIDSGYQKTVVVNVAESLKKFFDQEKKEQEELEKQLKEEQKKLEDQQKQEAQSQ